MKPPAWLSRHWRILAAVLVFSFFAPVALFLLPLAALLLASPPHPARVKGFAVFAALFGVFWLTQPGELPDQMVRAATAIVVCVFVPVTFFTRAEVTHRVIAAAAAAALGVATLCAALGRSWGEMTWWVERRIGHVGWLMMQNTWGSGGTGRFDQTEVADLIGASVAFLADYHPALITLQLMAGLALATSVYQRMAPRPRGLPQGRFRDFRFTEHLGWAAIAALVVVLVPRFAPAKLGAMNILLVLAALFGMRGAAVTTLGIQHIGGGCLTVVFGLAIVFLLLPIALIAMIVLGIVDTRFELRRRWSTPPSGG